MKDKKLLFDRSCHVPVSYTHLPRKAIDLFTAFRYNCLKSILSHPFRDFFKKSQKSLEALEQFSRSHAIYSRGLNMDGLTEQEIADKVGYKTASAVHKRIAKIADAYEDYVTAEYQKYLDK